MEMILSFKYFLKLHSDHIFNGFSKAPGSPSLVLFWFSPTNEKDILSLTVGKVCSSEFFSTGEPRERDVATAAPILQMWIPSPGSSPKLIMIVNYILL